MALQILAVLAGTANFAAVMTPVQMYQFAVITTIYVPCVATIAVLKHELGIKDTALIVLFTIVLALGIGILIRGGLRLLSFNFLSFLGRIINIPAMSSMKIFLF